MTRPWSKTHIGTYACAYTNGTRNAGTSFLLRVHYMTSRRYRGRRAFHPRPLFGTRSEKPLGIIARSDAWSRARACMTRFSRDSTCKSGQRTDLKRVHTYRRWLNSGVRLARDARTILRDERAVGISIAFRFYYVRFVTSATIQFWKIDAVVGALFRRRRGRHSSILWN